MADTIIQRNRRDPLASWPPPPEYVPVEDVLVIHRTRRAVLIGQDGDEFWVPLSQIEEADEYKAGESYTEIRVTEWFARKAKLI